MVIPPVNKVPALGPIHLPRLPPAAASGLGHQHLSSSSTAPDGRGLCPFAPLPTNIYTRLEFNKVAIYSLVNEQVSCCLCASTLRILIHSRGLGSGKRAPVPRSEYSQKSGGNRVL